VVVESEEAVAGAGNGLSDALELILEHDGLAELDAAQRRLAMRSLLIQEGRTSVQVRDVAAVVDGYGVIDDLMNDPAVTDILVNGVRDVWVERDGALQKTDVEFASADELAATIERLIARGGGRVDASRPIADVALPDGSRMHVVVPPLSPDGPKIAIRRFPRTPLSLEDLQRRGMFDAVVRERLERAVHDRATIAISGGTGTGKTTLLNALLGEIPSSERLLTLEETPELRPTCAHWVPLVARPPNVEGKGEVTLVDLFRGALRMRPDRIVVGEVRGAEARVALDAFSTGHPGSLVTLHASSTADVIERFVTLASGAEVPDATLRTRVRDAFDLVVHIERLNGVRRVAELLSP
jgi:pilus assembly protein CpaF